MAHMPDPKSYARFYLSDVVAMLAWIHTITEVHIACSKWHILAPNTGNET